MSCAPNSHSRAPSPACAAFCGGGPAQACLPRRLALGLGSRGGGHRRITGVSCRPREARRPAKASSSAAISSLASNAHVEPCAIFIAETDLYDPATTAPPLHIDTHGVEEILQAGWQLLQDITAEQERQASAPPPIHPTPQRRDISREGISFARQTTEATRETGPAPEPCPRRENPGWWATASVVRASAPPADEPTLSKLRESAGLRGARAALPSAAASSGV